MTKNMHPYKTQCRALKLFNKMLKCFEVVTSEKIRFYRKNAEHHRLGNSFEKLK